MRKRHCLPEDAHRSQTGWSALSMHLTLWARLGEMVKQSVSSGFRLMDLDVIRRTHHASHALTGLVRFLLLPFESVTDASASAVGAMSASPLTVECRELPLDMTAAMSSCVTRTVSLYGAMPVVSSAVIGSWRAVLQEAGYCVWSVSQSRTG